MPETIYRERCDGRWHYWTYSDGGAVEVGLEYVKREIARGRAVLVEVGA